MQLNISSAPAWIGLGIISRSSPPPQSGPYSAQVITSHRFNRVQSLQSSRAWNAEAIVLVLCFGASGVGYIIPATFLPVCAAVRRRSTGVRLGMARFRRCRRGRPTGDRRTCQCIGNRRLWMRATSSWPLAWCCR